MKINKLDNMKHGWFIGYFEPAILKTELFEVGHHHHKKGTSPIPHRHNILTEYNYIVSGELKIENSILSAGDFFIYEPGDIAYIDFLQDTDLIVIKVPSIPKDKEII